MTLNDFYELLEKYQNELPIKIVNLAEELGIEVYKSDLLPEDVAGKIEFEKSIDGNSSGKYTIIVNGHDHPVRRRFTIAHEIAHFVLHKEYLENGIVDRNTNNFMYRSSSVSNNQEYAANKLAAQILMPISKIKEEYDNGKKSVRELADSFYVSEEAMRIRLNS